MPTQINLSRLIKMILETNFQLIFKGKHLPSQSSFFLLSYRKFK
jgi:hypothetical protein